MELQLLILLAFNSLYIFGFHYSTDYALTVDKTPNPYDRELLWFVRWYLRNAPTWVQKPVFGCVACMASVHSWPFWLVNSVSLHTCVVYIIYTFALAGLNAIVNERIS